MSVIPRVLHGSSGSEDDVSGEAAFVRSIDPPPRPGDPISFGDTLRMHCKKAGMIRKAVDPTMGIETLLDVL